MAYEMGSPAAVDQKEETKKISFRFCRECSNMLYPKEDKMNNQLMFACRMCQWAEPADAMCIYRNALKEEIAETAGNVEDVAQDPTVGDDSDLYVDDLEGDDEEMYGSGRGGYVYHGQQPDDDDDDDDDEKMGENEDDDETVPELCTLCGKQILCPFCHKPSSNGLTLETNDPLAATAGNPQQEAEQLPHTDSEECAKCHTRDAVFFQSQQRTNETGMALFFVCVECYNVWSTLDKVK